MKLKELTEAKQTPISTEIQPWMFRTKKEILAWLEKSPIVSFKINPNLTVSARTTAIITKPLLTEYNGKRFLPVKFSQAMQSFSAIHVGLSSLHGLPTYCRGSIRLSHNLLTSLYNIHKHIKELDGVLNVFNNPITSNILGLLYIKGLKHIDVGLPAEGRYTSQEKKLLDAIEIINKHLAGDRNIHFAQEELIEGGLSEFAKL